MIKSNIQVMKINDATNWNINIAFKLRGKKNAVIEM